MIVTGDAVAGFIYGFISGAIFGCISVLVAALVWPGGDDADEGEEDD